MSGENSSENVTYRSLDFLGFPYYRVGDDGSVWSEHPGTTSRMTLEVAGQIRKRYEAGGVMQKELAREFGCSVPTISMIVNHKTHLRRQWEKLSQLPRQKGHLTVLLTNGEGQKRLSVHRLVLLAFVGPCPQGMECCHFPDRDPSNNCLENLRWDTKQANQADKRMHGTDTIGERHGLAKLTDQAVQKIRELYSAGDCTQLALASQFGVSRGTITDVLQQRTWRHVLAKDSG